MSQRPFKRCDHNRDVTFGTDESAGSIIKRAGIFVCAGLRMRKQNQIVGAVVGGSTNNRAVEATGLYRHHRLSQRDQRRRTRGINYRARSRQLQHLCRKCRSLVRMKTRQGLRMSEWPVVSDGMDNIGNDLLPNGDRQFPEAGEVIDKCQSLFNLSSQTQSAAGLRSARMPDVDAGRFETSIADFQPCISPGRGRNFSELHVGDIGALLVDRRHRTNIPVQRALWNGASQSRIRRPDLAFARVDIQ